MVLVIRKTSRPNLRIYFEFCLWSGVFYFILLWYHFFIYTLMSNGGKADRHRYTYTHKHTDTHADRHTHTCLSLSHTGTCPGRRERFHLVPKITEGLIPEFSPLGGSKAKSHLLTVRDAQLLCMVLPGSLNGSVATLW